VLSQDARPGDWAHSRPSTPSDLISGADAAAPGFAGCMSTGHAVVTRTAAGVGGSKGHPLVGKPERTGEAARHRPPEAARRPGSGFRVPAVERRLLGRRWVHSEQDRRWVRASRCELGWVHAASHHRWVPGDRRGTRWGRSTAGPDFAAPIVAARTDFRPLDWPVHPAHVP
jgi:hypothetical protein